MEILKPLNQLQEKMVARAIFKLHYIDTPAQLFEAFTPPDESGDRAPPKPIPIFKNRSNIEEPQP